MLLAVYRKIIHFTNDEFDIQRVKQIEEYISIELIKLKTLVSIILYE